jgi:hypothetical protein
MSNLREILRREEEISSMFYRGSEFRYPRPGDIDEPAWVPYVEENRARNDLNSQRIMHNWQKIAGNTQELYEHSIQLHRHRQEINILHENASTMSSNFDTLQKVLGMQSVTLGQLLHFMESRFEEIEGKARKDKEEVERHFKNLEDTTSPTLEAVLEFFSNKIKMLEERMDKLEERLDERLSERKVKEAEDKVTDGSRVDELERRIGDLGPSGFQGRDYTHTRISRLEEDFARQKRRYYDPKAETEPHGGRN